MQATKEHGCVQKNLSKQKHTYQAQYIIITSHLMRMNGIESSPVKLGVLLLDPEEQ